MADARPSLHHQCRREDVRFVQSPALLVLVSLSLEAAIGESSSETEDRLLEGVLHSAAETESQAVLLTKVVINLGVEGSAVFSKLRVLLIVVAQAVARMWY